MASDGWSDVLRRPITSFMLVSRESAVRKCSVTAGGCDPDKARVARGRGSRVADFGRGRGSRVAGLRHSATPPTLDRARNRTSVREKESGREGGSGGGEEGERQGGKSDAASEGRKRLSVCGERRAEGKRDAFAAGGEEGRSVRACIPEE